MTDRDTHEDEIKDLSEWVTEMLAFQRANLVLLIIAMFIIFGHILTDVIIHF